MRRVQKLKRWIEKFKYIFRKNAGVIFRVREETKNALNSMTNYLKLVTLQPIGRWIPNQDLSTTRTAVYEAHGHCIITFRGTDLQSGKDWKNNCLLALGLNRLTVQYKRDKRLVNPFAQIFISDAHRA